MLNVAALTAIDVHVHVHNSVAGGTVADDSAEAAVGAYFGRMDRHTLPEIAAMYRERRMACVVFTVDAPTASGHEPSVPNEEIAELAAQHADTVIPFASVDPARGRAGARWARRLIEEHGVRGFILKENAARLLGLTNDEPEDTR